MTDDTEHNHLSEDEQQLMDEMMLESENDLSPYGEARRHFLKMMTLAGGGMLAFNLFGGNELFAQVLTETGLPGQGLENTRTVSFRINNVKRTLEVDSRMTLLDALRERLQLTGSKKGCDHGQCGACTVLVDGKRVLSCLTLTATCEGKTITSIEGLAKEDALHPVQAAFLKHDGFQCGFCTPGQICSAVALLEEAKRGEVSYVTNDVRKERVGAQLSDEEIRERMSGNLCRCGAYPNIVSAISEVHTGKEVAQAWHFVPQQATQHSAAEIKKGGSDASL